MANAIAINVAANTTLPGVRGPIYPDGRFVYLPIPERKPTRAAATVPTYRELVADLDALPFSLSAETLELPVHLDPEFAGYPGCSQYTYGDEHAIKAGPLSTLSPGDSLFFYATLTRYEQPPDGETGPPTGWVAPDWGAYLIGEFRIERVVDADGCQSLSAAERELFGSNAHCKRETYDPKVLVRGNSDSRLFDRAIPLSTATSGATANRIVTELSTDSGKGPWWRRQLRFDAGQTETLRRLVARPVDLDPAWTTTE